MNRVGIFCLYTRTGDIDKTVKHTLIELKNVIEYLVIVVNGFVNNKEDIYLYADDVLFRENSGFDIGAFKCAILSPKYKNRIKESEELVLCNSSFYGPFIPFKDIFESMESSEADFWGLSSSEKNLVEHIQSYFIVFRNRIIKGEELFTYLKERVDIRKLDYFDACSIFENGLFWILKKAGYKFDAYKRNIDCDNYSNPYGSLKIDRLPILKKKIFSQEFYEKERVMNALSYINKIYSYDIGILLDDVYRNYNIKICKEDIERHQIGVASKNIFQNKNLIDKEDIESFIDSHEEMFIYGYGKMAKHIYSCFFFYERNPKLKGFIVSDDQPIIEECFRGYPVYHTADIDNIFEKAVIVALNWNNTRDVINQLKGIKNIKLLWKRI